MSHGTVSRSFDSLNKPSDTILTMEFHRAGNIMGNGWNDDKEQWIIDLMINKETLHTRAKGISSLQMVTSHPKLLFQTLIKSDGSVAAVNNISNTMWDRESPTRN